MASNKDIWRSIEQEQRRHDSLNLGEVRGYAKFLVYSIIAHSTAMEGSSFSEHEVQLLFDEGITKKGNIVEHFMNLDLKAAYEYAAIEAKKQTPVTPDFLKKLNALVMKNTGAMHFGISGAFDSSRGDYRLCGVTAGFGGKSHMDYQKVPENADRFCEELNRRMPAKGLQEQYNLAFDAHLNIVTIHP